MQAADVFLEDGEVFAALHLLEQVALRRLLPDRECFEDPMPVKQPADFLGPCLDVSG